jgi:hypothetical protein
MKKVPALFFKAHVDAYTRKDGTVVQAHDDQRAAAKEKEKASNERYAKFLESGGKEVDHNHADYRYKKGQQIKIRPQWQDKGDGDYDWHVAEDQDPRGGRVVVHSSATKDWKIRPTHVVTPDMIEPHKGDK